MNGPLLSCLLPACLLVLALAGLKLPDARRSDRNHARYLRVKAKYQLNLGRLAKPVVQSKLNPPRTAR